MSKIDCDCYCQHYDDAWSGPHFPAKSESNNQHSAADSNFFFFFGINQSLTYVFNVHRNVMKQPVP